MPFYEYRDPDSGNTVLSEERGDWLMVDGRRWKRVWGFHMARVWHEHWNPSTGSVVSSRQQFRDDLKRRSEEATERTGIPHNFVEVDITDKKALGVTDEGLE